MAATLAQIGKGTSVGYNATTTGSSFTTIAEVIDIKMPKYTATPVEIERYDSPSLFPELIQSWAKGGDLELTMIYTSTKASAIYGMFNTSCQFQVTKPDNSTVTYSGIVTSMGDVVPLKDKMTIDCTFAVSGAPVNSSGAGLEKPENKPESLVVHPEHKAE